MDADDDYERDILNDVTQTNNNDVFSKSFIANGEIYRRITRDGYIGGTRLG